MYSNAHVHTHTHTLLCRLTHAHTHTILSSLHFFTYRHTYMDRINSMFTRSDIQNTHFAINWQFNEATSNFKLYVQMQKYKFFMSEIQAACMAVKVQICCQKKANSRFELYVSYICTFSMVLTPPLSQNNKTICTIWNQYINKLHKTAHKPFQQWQRTNLLSINTVIQNTDLL